MAKDGGQLRVSYGEYVYEHVAGWAPLPDGWEGYHVVGLGVEGQDNIYAYNGSALHMIALDKGGGGQATWGEDAFSSAHHLFAGPDDSLYTTDIGDGTVRKWDAKGASSSSCCVRLMGPLKPLAASLSTSPPMSRRDMTARYTWPTAMATRGCISSRRTGRSSGRGESPGPALDGLESPQHLR